MLSSLGVFLAGCEPGLRPLKPRRDGVAGSSSVFIFDGVVGTSSFFTLLPSGSDAEESESESKTPRLTRIYRFGCDFFEKCVGCSDHSRHQDRKESFLISTSNHIQLNYTQDHGSSADLQSVFIKLILGLMLRWKYSETFTSTSSSTDTMVHRVSKRTCGIIDASQYPMDLLEGFGPGRSDGSPRHPASFSCRGSSQHAAKPLRPCRSA